MLKEVTASSAPVLRLKKMPAYVVVIYLAMPTPRAKGLYVDVHKHENTHQVPSYVAKFVSMPH